MKRALRQLHGFADGVRRATAGVRRMVKWIAGAAGIGSIAAFTLAVKKSMETLDGLAKASDRLGIASEKLAGLRRAATLAGMGTQQLDQSLLYLRRRISEAATGLATAKRAFDLMGLSAEDLMALPLDQQLAAIADGMRRLWFHSDRVRVAMDIFGRSGAGMVVLLKDGATGLRGVNAEAERLGLALGRTALRAIERANDRLSDMRSALAGMSNTLAVTLAPYLETIATDLTNVFVKLRQEGGSIGDVLVDAFERAGYAAGTVLDAINAIRLAIIDWKMAGLQAASEAAGAPSNVGMMNLGLFAGLMPEWLIKKIAASGTIARARHEATGEELVKLWQQREAIAGQGGAAERFARRAREYAVSVQGRAGFASLWTTITEMFRSFFRKPPVSLLPEAMSTARGAMPKYTATPYHSRMFIPPGIGGAVGPSKVQPVRDDKLHDLLDTIFGWIKANPGTTGSIMKAIAF